jgi:hypothetical protein
MLLIVMDDDDTPEGWTDTEYKEFKVDDGSDSDSDSESESEKEDMKGYQKKEYKKILVVEELLPE